MIQIDMEMPKNCNLCQLQVLDADGHHTCAPDTKSRDVDIEIINGTKAVFCPLLDVPDINAGKWISVKDRLPPERDSIFAKVYGTKQWNPNMFQRSSDDVRVVVRFEDGTRMVSHDHTVDGKWHSEMEKCAYPKRKVTHWMENPELPEES